MCRSMFLPIEKEGLAPVSSAKPSRLTTDQLNQQKSPGPQLAQVFVHRQVAFVHLMVRERAGVQLSGEAASPAPGFETCTSRSNGFDE